MRSTTRVSSTSVTSTAAPSRASVSAQASPMPEAPPVTMATLPETCPIALAALPVARPFLGVGLDAFLEVLGLARPVLLGEFALGGDFGRVSEAAAHGLARRLHGKRRAFGDLGGKCQGRLAHVGQRH